MSEMIDRVVQALNEEFGRQKDSTSAGPLIYGTPINVEALARAAIDAMREPTEAMERTGDSYMETAAFSSTIWDVMIDAAIGEGDAK